MNLYATKTWSPRNLEAMAKGHVRIVITPGKHKDPPVGFRYGIDNGRFILLENPGAPWDHDAFVRLIDKHGAGAGEGFEAGKGGVDAAVLEAGEVFAADAAQLGELGLTPAATLTQAANTISEAGPAGSVSFYHRSRMRANSTTVRDSNITYLDRTVNYRRTGVTLPLRFLTV